MKSVVIGRIKKWMVFAAIGCVAYFVGYIWGQTSQKTPVPHMPASVQAPAVQK